VVVPDIDPNGGRHDRLMPASQRVVEVVRASYLSLVVGATPVAA